jgi:hypothetical protein
MITALIIPFVFGVFLPFLQEWFATGTLPSPLNAILRKAFPSFSPKLQHI